MTRDSFIQLISDELTVGCSLPYALNLKEYNRIINSALRWAYIDYQYAVQEHRFILDHQYFHSDVWKRTHSIKLPECVAGLHGIREIKGYKKISYFGADFSSEKMIAQEIYLSPFSSDDLVLRTAYESYWDLSKAFFIDTISYDYNHNSRIAYIIGRDPKTAVSLDCSVKIPEESLFEDWTFQRYCVAQARISLGRILGTFSYNLPGGITINAESIKQDGEDELDKILEKVDSENAPDWFYMYHA